MGASATRIKGFLNYETVQIVRIRNVRVSLIYHFSQLLILGYVLGYGLIYKKAYQATGQVSGSADIKVKGVGYVNQTLPWNGPSNSTCPGNSCFHIYDSYDLVMPPMEENALFVTSNMWVTKGQKRGICPSYLEDNRCDKKACAHMAYVQNGRQTGHHGSCRVNYTDPQQLWPQILPKGGFCDVYAWCPTELEPWGAEGGSIVDNFGISGVHEFTVFVRMNVNYPKFGVTLDNTRGSNVTTKHMNLWTLEEMVRQTGSEWVDIQNQGTTIGMNAVWDCDFDKPEGSCVPKISFVRLDSPDSKLSSGFNFRSVVEFLHDKAGTRQLTKHYGVRLLVLISGVGAKYDTAAMFTAIGAGIGLLSIATLIADFIATKLLANKGLYNAAKFKEVEVDSDEEDEEKNDHGEKSHLQQEHGGSTYSPPILSAAPSNLHAAAQDDGQIESWGMARFPK